MSDEKLAELSAAQPRKRGRGRPFPEGKSGCPGGQSKEKRAFLDRLKTDDAEEVYRAFMELVRDGNAPAILRAVEYLAGKPPAAPEDHATVMKASVAGLGMFTKKELATIAGLPLDAHDPE